MEFGKKSEAAHSTLQSSLIWHNESLTVQFLMTEYLINVALSFVDGNVVKELRVKLDVEQDIHAAKMTLP